MSKKSNPRGGRRDGAGRPQKYGEPLIYLRIGFPESVLKDLDREAKDLGMTRAECIIKRLGPQ